MKRLAVVLALLCLLLVPVVAGAHGTSKITRHRIVRLDGEVRARGVYVTSRPHRLVVTVFIIQGDRIIAENTNRTKGRRIKVSVTAECRRTTPVYAVIQGDTAKGGHFASWNSRKVVCKR